ncbi:hypothetical protein C8Q78DRAFT_517851 [Trametes maxima]|nr:hypothetical protein C8Q78DRAFT_517851 [Trametes maxima]
MPATRTEHRQGSRSATLLRQGSADVRSAGSDIIALSSDYESSAHKKVVAEKKSARQRSKQKARAPLPPPTEIIEISSDDEPPPKRPSTSTHPLERRIKQLEEENKKWKEAALTAQAQIQAQAPPSPSASQEAPPPASLEAPSSDNKLDKFLSAVDEHIACEICTMKMWSPYTLACGHSFCKDCLQDWFSTALAQHMATHPQYNPHVTIPHHWRAALAQPHLTPLERRQLEYRITGFIATTPQPTYSCPTCRVEVVNKPAENFVVKHVVRTIAAAQGESCPKEDPPRRMGGPADGPWDGFFPLAR